MIHSIAPITTEHPDAALHPALRIPAVAHCSDSWTKVHRATLEKTRDVYAAGRCAAIAYRLAMPPLSGYHNICDFIASAGYGILLGAFKKDMGSKLLYAAQVALGSLPREAKTLSRAPSLPEPAVIDLPTPPPLLPEPEEKETISSKKPVSPHRNAGVPDSAAGFESLTV